MMQLMPPSLKLEQFNLHSNMRQHISIDLKELVVKPAIVRGYQCKKIRRITGISVRSIKHVKALYLQTGEVVERRVVDGRPHILNSFEASVWN